LCSHSLAKQRVWKFTVWLGVGQQKGAGKIVPEKLATLRALIVDDNAGARDIIDDLLTGVVPQRDAVASGPEAIAAVKEADAAEPYGATCQKIMLSCFIR
jgi:polar amino acid transport system substrate-binding protein